MRPGQVGIINTCWILKDESASNFCHARELLRTGLWHAVFSKVSSFFYIKMFHSLRHDDPRFRAGAIYYSLHEHFCHRMTRPGMLYEGK
ncbi:hypothetical protein PanWU01x14_315970 [Parasponia andersonii]|uniref:Uncharacterized protein n=1 Tax=Parasponia andersonii TaxID=3476 RepID=A0A2P5ANE9_PARAD|nr:hypothetical protein PanWU01x14_315970 [Parasponia andersonii]